MRKLALVLVGALLGALTWQVAFAVAPLDSIEVCSRPGADLRTPGTNGQCPSGYTKTVIEDGEDGQDGADGTTPGWHDVGAGGLAPGDPPATIVSVDVPAGSYFVSASGALSVGSGTTTIECLLDVGGGGEIMTLTDSAGGGAERLTVTDAVELDAPGTIAVECELLSETSPASSPFTWRLTVLQADITFS